METETVSQDVRDLDAVRRRLETLDAARPVDQAFVNAGVITGQSPSGAYESVDDACRTMAVNALAAVNMIAFLF